MRAHGPRRDIERRADLLVRPAKRDQPHDLELATGEPGDAARRRALRRTSTETPQLLARAVELRLRAEVREHFVHPSQLAHGALGVPRLEQRLGELTPHTR